MNDPWAGPRVRTTLDRLAIDRQRFIRDCYELAASFEDGAAGQSKGSWLAAKYCEHFASYLAEYDPGKMRTNLEELARVYRDRKITARTRDWRRWQRFLRERS